MISIIVPIYNTESYLAQCIDSLLCQTEKDVQIILVDDQSTDGSLAIAQAYAQKDRRIEVYSQPHAGQSAARNYGLSFAKGDYIAFVDADDTIEPDWCERHLAAINSVDYVQSGYTRLSAKTPRHQFQFTSPCMRLYRRETIARLQFAPGFIYEDVLFSTDLWLSNATCRRIDYTGYIYTPNPNSTTSVPHPEARQAVVRTFRGKAKVPNLKARMILWYTLFVYKCHFILR